MMKKPLFSFLLLLSIFSFAQQSHNGLPVIHASAAKADYKIGETWTRGSWGIDPTISPDIIQIPCFSKQIPFSFCTDRDTISFTVDAKTTRQFYVQLADGRYALTEIRGFEFEPVRFDEEKRTTTYSLRYEDRTSNAYLEQLKKEYRLDTLTNGVQADTEKALRILKWVHDQWRHDGDNEPVKKDAISILEEAKKGKNFRCVEYGIVATAALNAVGLPARVMALKMKDVETIEYGAGHVLLEVYLPDLKKWVLLDGQWDVMPVLNGVPLNAVEFQQAIAKNYDQLEIRSASGTDKEAYCKWIYHYLYYFDVAFDNRQGRDIKRETINGKSHLMLVPAGAKEPKVFQKRNPITYSIYTNSLADFYAPPGGQPNTSPLR